MAPDGTDKPLLVKRQLLAAHLFNLPRRGRAGVPGVGRGTLTLPGPEAAVKQAPPLWPGFCLEPPWPRVALTVAMKTTSGDRAGPREIPQGLNGGI